MPGLPVDSRFSLVHATAAVSDAVGADATAMAEPLPAHEEVVAVVSTNGKQAHAIGQCTPCAYFWYKKDGCRKGEDCQFCHLCEKGELKKRKKHRIQDMKAAGAFI